MTLDELKDALLAADPAVVLLPGHLLSRVIREVHGLPTQVIQVPHHKSLILDRAILLRHVEPDDLDLGPDRLLPQRVILLARPNLDRRNSLEGQATLLKYWRRLFHASIHLHLERRAAEGLLGATVLEERIERIGQTEFEEAWRVLEQEGFLFPKPTLRDVYVEFTAVYLEFRFFLPELLPVYFPAIRDFQRVDEVLAHDVNAQVLFERTRLAGADGPGPRNDETTDEPTDVCWRLTREARRVSRAGNNVRGAILRTRASRIAPAALTVRLREEAANDIEQLIERLREALKLSDDDCREWRKDLPPLLEKTGEEQWSVEARLLYDLQNACVDHEREVYALDIVEWVMSIGKKPIKRPLTNQRIVRITRHLRTAAGRLASTRLSEADRQHLGRLLNDAVRQNELRLRSRFRPALTDAINDVGLQATSPPEQAAQQKLVEELLDRITEVGFITFSDLRDAISRNNLKLPDLTDPAELVRGDPLLRLDRLLSHTLDGVYRPSEFYLRVLQRITAPNFGTPAGRLFTRYFTIPFGGALVALEGVDLVLREWHNHFGDKDEPHRPLFGPISVLIGLFFPSTEPGVGAPLLPALAPTLWVLLGLLFVGLLYVPRFRQAFRNVGVEALRLGKRLFIDWPVRVLPIQQLRTFLFSWPIQLLFRLVLKPLPICVLLWWLFPSAFLSNAEPPQRVVVAQPAPIHEDDEVIAAGKEAGVDAAFAGAAVAFPPLFVQAHPREIQWLYVLGLYVAVAVAFNSRQGRAIEEIVSRALVQFITWVRAGLIGGIIRLLVQLSKWFLDCLEYIMYTVDEWLRFRGGDTRLSMVMRAILGVIWFPVSYVVRFYIVILIEPGFNPIKMPVSIAAAKFVYPIVLAIQLHKHLAGLLATFLPSIVAETVSASTIWLLPDAFGFLFWEMKENWRLYHANRRPALAAVTLGPRGETLLQLLKPGFHSGTVPKLFAQLRRTERQAQDSGGRREARGVREKLTRIEESLRRFVDRELLALLHQSPEWAKQPLTTGAVNLASNQVRLELRHRDYPEAPLRVAIAEQGGLLAARVEDPGWVHELSPAERISLSRALAGTYKLAGVTVVREQVQAQLPPGTACEMTDRGLVLRADDSDHEDLFDVGKSGTIAPHGLNGTPGDKTVSTPLGFAPISWEEWVQSWLADREGAAVPNPLPVLPKNNE